MNPNYIMREYDNALFDILNTGFDIDGDRTGVGTIAKLGINTEYDISERVPVMTKRKVAWKSIVKEVLWYISGSSNINDLEAMGAKIWTPWKSKEFETKHGFAEGSAGYVYGFNLIHFGADVKQVESRRLAEQNPFNTVDGHMLDEIYPKSKGFNQLDYVINTLRANPKSRQACFTFWRPDTNDQAILPACHAFYSFVVSPDENGKMNILNCHLFQRSADWFVGVGMGNLWTATLFTYMIAQQLGMKPGRVYHSGAHCHVYKNQLELTGQYDKSPIDEYLARTEEPNSPILKLKKRDSIYDYDIDDFELLEYNPLPGIKVPIAI